MYLCLFMFCLFQMLSLLFNIHFLLFISIVYTYYFFYFIDIHVYFLSVSKSRLELGLEVFAKAEVNLTNLEDSETVDLAQVLFPANDAASTS